MILNDIEITKLAVEQDMVSPFVNKSVSNGINNGNKSFVLVLRTR